MGITVNIIAKLISDSYTLSLILLSKNFSALLAKFISFNFTLPEGYVSAFKI